MNVQVDILISIGTMLITTLVGVATVTWRASVALQDIKEKSYLQMSSVHDSFLSMTERLARIEEGLSFLRSSQVSYIMRTEHDALADRVRVLERTVSSTKRLDTR